MNQDKLKELLIYNPENGVFYWRVKRKGGKGIGKQAGTLTTQGYVDVCIGGVKYGAHRLAFIYMDGKCPSSVDHINNIKSDNSWANLRKASIRENAFNYKGGNNQSNYRNVYYDPRGKKKWFVRITDSNGAKISLGYFESPEEANVVASNARKAYHGEFFNEI